MMPSATISLFSTPLLFNGRQPHFTTPSQFQVSTVGESKRRITVVAKATGESSESSLSLVKSVQNVAIDKLPLVPSTLELIGILLTSWFIYRYLLFKPDREELLRTVNKSISEILGQ